MAALKSIIRKVIGAVVLLLTMHAKSHASHELFNFKQDGPADSVYLFAYSRDEGRSGLLLAWSNDQQHWNGIGPHHRFLFSDFGRWGSQKRMFDPYLFQDGKGIWHCVWSLNEGIGQFAHAASENLYEWDSQVYPEVMPKGGVYRPEITQRGDNYQVSWVGEKENEFYETRTSIFKDFSERTPVKAENRLNDRVEVTIDGKVHEGVINQVNWELVEGLIKHYEWSQYHEQERRESMNDDPERFADLGSVDAKISIFPDRSKTISDELIGIFFEDISYAADGGLYAELIQNRDFEYLPRDKGGWKEWNHWWSWSYGGDKYGFKIDSTAPIHPNNKYYAVLEGQPASKGLVNEGWDGIPLKANEKYDFSVFTKSLDTSGKSILVRLVNSDGSGNYGEAKVKGLGTEWKKYEAVIKATETVPNAHLEVIPQSDGKIALDMISLFPQKTFKGRKNGLRADLAQTIADLNPRFVRFPGGCVAHGDGLDNIYRWKSSIGKLEERVPMRNIWNYHQTLGLGYYEYFQFCEDLGAQPVPVLAAGVPCQNSGTGGHGQCGGIPLGEMDEYVQDVLDLIEYANGDKNTEWGKKRAESGHPEPFNLKYLGIGNEDLITDIFKERFEMIYDAVKEKYPEIIVIGTVGPFYQGTDYEVGWDFAKELEVPMVDEHYYVPPGWLLNNQDFYDKYDRNGPKVYLGEYAAHVHGRRLNMETALTEAIYLTSVERNADVVQMTSYAPMLAKENKTNWNPDLIYFNNTEVKLTTSYYVQQLFGQNAGQEYLPSFIDLPGKGQDVKKRVAASVVKDQKSGDYIIKLVNLLPQKVNATMDLSPLGNIAGQAILKLMQGDPKDEGVEPEVSEIAVGSDTSYTLPAYSFSVIRIEQK